MIVVDRPWLHDAFDRVPARLNHSLAATGLFTLERIATLVETIFTAGQAHRLALLEPLDDPGRGFPKSIFRTAHPGIVAELATRRYKLGIRDPGAVDPDYRDAYHAVIREAGRSLGQPLLQHSRRGHLTLLASSPGVVTPYHLDFEHNFLCQVAGAKEVWLWRPDDRAILSETEIERFHCGNMAAGRWRPDAQSRAMRFLIAPGDALYHPPLAPHWVKNGSAVSVSASFTFSTPAIEQRSRIYQANPYVRRLRLGTPPPGSSVLADRARLALLAAVKQWKRVRRRTGLAGAISRARN